MAHPFFRRVLSHHLILSFLNANCPFGINAEKHCILLELTASTLFPKRLQFLEFPTLQVAVVRFLTYLPPARPAHRKRQPGWSLRFRFSSYGAFAWPAARRNYFSNPTPRFAFTNPAFPLWGSRSIISIISLSWPSAKGCSQFRPTATQKHASLPTAFPLSSSPNCLLRP